MVPRAFSLPWAVLASLCVSPCEAASLRASMAHAANPVRKVVGMLQAMEKKVREQGEREQNLFDKFMCYCKTGVGALEKSISDAETKIPALKADMESTSEQVEEMKETLKQEKMEQESAERAMEEAGGLREKEAADYARERDDYNANIDAVKKAIIALENGMAGSFLQTNLAAVLKRATSQADLLQEDKAQVISFLSGGEGLDASYAPQSGQIVGILKQMLDTMEKNLAEATEQEQQAIQTYQNLTAAKKKELDALTASIESKTRKVGELNVAVVEMKADLDDTEESLVEDQAFLKELDKSCSTKDAEWAERQKTRSAELLAISETIKLLNDDEALDLFKKSLPTQPSSLLQVQVSSEAVVRRARKAIKRARLHASRRFTAKIDLIALATSAKKIDFAKVVKLIDEMVDMLKEEQKEDEKKRQYCEKEFDLAEDKKKVTENTVDDAKHNAESCKSGITTLTEEITALVQGIKTLDVEVSDQTQQRKDENEEYREVLASDTAAKELLQIARNRLYKFYNPNLYVPPAKQELSGTSAVARDFGVEFVQVSDEGQEEADPGPAPETFGRYEKNNEGSTGVIQMVNMLIKNLDTGLEETQVDEKNAQVEYEIFVRDSAEKRRADTKAIADKEETKANLESDLEEYKAATLSAFKELEATAQYIKSLHAQCDFLQEFFEVRKKALSGEIDALLDAKAILTGADFSF